MVIILPLIHVHYVQNNTAGLRAGNTTGFITGITTPMIDDSLVIPAWIWAVVLPAAPDTC